MVWGLWSLPAPGSSLPFGFASPVPLSCLCVDSLKIFLIFPQIFLAFFSVIGLVQIT